MRCHPTCLAAIVLLAACASGADSACCYFSAKNADILQPAQKVFITWDPKENVESFTVQPMFEGNALDFGMVIPTPSQPKLSEMPRDFFKHLAIFTVLKKRLGAGGKKKKGDGADPGPAELKPGDLPTIKILEVGVVGSLDYKIIEATRADDLFAWLKNNKYQYAGDEATLNHYIQKKWLFTVMKIDTMQMKRNKDGTFDGEVTPTRFQFETDKLIYPLKITQISVREKTEALFYVQAPYKVDLPGELSYQYMWVPMLQASQKKAPPNIPPAIAPWFSVIPGGGHEWLVASQPHIPKLLENSRQLGYVFERGKRPAPNAKGRTPTMIEWAKKLTDADFNLLQGTAPYNGRQKAPIPGTALGGYVQRYAPDEELKGLQQLVGHLQLGSFITKFRKTFTRSEMNDDLLIVPARVGDAADNSEYEEILARRRHKVEHSFRECGAERRSEETMAKNLTALIDYLDNLRQPPTLNALTAELAEMEIDLAELAPFVLYSAQAYRRNLIKASRHYNLLVLCWKNGQRSPIHDHVGSNCALRVLQGTMTETLFEFAPNGHVKATGSRDVCAGTVVGSADTDMHQVSNLQAGDADLITLHIYSPPLLVMGTYSLHDRERGEEPMYLAFSDAAGI